MSTKYQALVPNRIFIGGADDVPELMKNEKIDMVYDLRAKTMKASIIIQEPTCQSSTTPSSKTSP
jgi:hypothetical protein